MHAEGCLGPCATRLAFALSVSASLVWLSGCALAMPSTSFGSTTPGLRTDVAGGAAVRIARGDLRASSNDVVDRAAHAAAVDASGVVPVVSARYGLQRHLDVGIVAAGSGARFDVRHERVLREGSTRVALVYGLGPSYTFVAPVDHQGGGAHLVGLEPLVSFGVEFGGLYEAWVGPRLSLAGLTGRFEDAMGVLGDTRAMRLDAGGVFGIAGGLRRVHGFLELTMLYEHWWGRTGATSVDRSGLVVIPAFGVRIRI